MKKFSFNKKKTSVGTLEFLVVFIVLFVFFLTIIDLGLFFRQIYLVQTISDEALAELETNHTCSEDLMHTRNILTEIANNYYGSNTVLVGTFESGFNNFRGGNYIFMLRCRTPKVPDAISFGYRYSGLFLFRTGRYIYSDFSSNTSFY